MRAFLLGLALSILLTAPAVACGGSTPPKIVTAVDALLPEANLSQQDLAKVKELRAQMIKLAARGAEAQARKVEEQAMLILGYSKAWMRCGAGSFMWMKTPAKS
jgi:hypothetical protein